MSKQVPLSTILSDSATGVGNFVGKLFHEESYRQWWARYYHYQAKRPGIYGWHVAFALMGAGYIMCSESIRHELREERTHELTLPLPDSSH